MNTVSFERPPIVETLLGIQFKRVEGLTNGHLGLIWKSLGDQWPHVKDVPPLEPQSEQFGDAVLWDVSGMIRLRMTQDASSRLQVRNLSDDRMVQVQNGMLVYNWIGSAGRKYPRYSAIRAEFDVVWAKFLAFLKSERLSTPEPTQWEVTYVNRIARGTVWERPADWGSLLTFGPRPVAGVENLALESLQGQWHYELTPARGRLHVEINHGSSPNRPDEPEALSIRLTARGPARNQEDFDAGLSLGHTTIVKTFRAMTSEDARRFWGEEEDDS